MSYNELILIQIRMIFIHIHRIIFFYKNFFSQFLVILTFNNSMSKQLQMSAFCNIIWSNSLQEIYHKLQ